MPDFLELSKQAFEASTSYIDANYRSDWDYSLKAFRNEHAPGSKYNSPEYAARSRIFHPKTRSIIRKNEAAGLQAAFSNKQMVNVEPSDPDNLMNVASAAALKEVMEYRLSRSIPTFETYLGGLQDAQTTGTVCSYQYWEYEQRGGKKKKDKPCITLRPIENQRFDAGADWIDVVTSSPYYCDIIPMYVCDVRAMMNNKDEKTGAPKWKKLDDAQILQARPDLMDSTRRARLGLQQDPQTESTGIKAFDIVWVLRWFMRDSQGEDHTYYTMGTEDTLCEAKPIDEVYFHGKRPYVIGYAVLETHKALKSSLPILVRPLQQSINNIGNQRFDNVQFVLNKRWLVARGRQVDVQSLVRNVPGGVTLVSDPKNDVQESNWPDVTSSSYVEHDRMNAEFDDLAGNFSPSTKVSNNAVNDTLGGSRMAAQGAGLMTELLLRTVNETWWEKVLRQLALLEQYYETDEVVLAVCAKKAQLFPRFGMSGITDEMLMNEVIVSVDMAMGDPNQRLQKFLMAINACIAVISTAPPGVNAQEACKEIMSNAGYRDGSRFFNQQEDPRLVKAMQMLQQMKQALEGKQMELQANAQVEQAKIASAEKQKAAQLQVDQQRISGDLAIRQAELAIEEQRVQLERLKLEIEARGSDMDLTIRATQMQADIDQAQLKLQGEREKQAAAQIQGMQDMEKTALEMEHTRLEMANEERVTQMAGEVSASMQGVQAEMDSVREAMKSAKQDVSDAKAQLAEFNKGMNAIAGIVLQKKRKATGFKLVKPDGKKTASVVISFDDGTDEQMAVN